MEKGPWKQGKEIIEIALENDKDVLEIVKENNMQQISDDSFILDIVNKVLSENPTVVAEYKDGKDRAIKYLMGQVMKESKGKINPALANEVLMKEISKYWFS